MHERVPDDVLVLPVQWLGYSQHHIRYPGTISAISETHLMLMMDIVASMVGYGFKKILIQNSHGGNGANISVLLQRLMERYGETVNIRNFDGEPGISEMDALVAYLQMLGTLVDFSTFTPDASR